MELINALAQFDPACLCPADLSKRFNSHGHVGWNNWRIFEQQSGVGDVASVSDGPGSCSYGATCNRVNEKNRPALWLCAFVVFCSIGCLDGVVGIAQ